MTNSILTTQRAVLTVAIAMVALMALTRGELLGSTLAFTLHDASWAVFLLGGMLLARWGWLAMFGALALVLDLTALCQGTLALASCLRPSYPVLVMTWVLLWSAGRACRLHIERDRWMSVAVIAVVTTALAYLVSNAGFYAFSGFFAEQTLVGFFEMSLPHFARAMVTTLVYVLSGLSLVAIVRHWRGPADGARIDG